MTTSGEFSPRCWPSQVDTGPAHLGDQLGYVCVTNEDSRLVGRGLFRLPLNPDYTLSTSWLPPATGLYYYSADNQLVEVLQDEDKLYPPSSGEEIIYITRKITSASAGKNVNEIFGSKLIVPRRNCNCSKLKVQVKELGVAIQELRKEIGEFKRWQSITGSELNIDANIFIPMSDRYAFTKYNDENLSLKEMEKCVDILTVENEAACIQEMEKSVDMKLTELLDYDSSRSSVSVKTELIADITNPFRITTINTTTANPVLNLSSVKIKTGISSKLSPLQTSKAKSIPGKLMEKSGQNQENIIKPYLNCDTNLIVHILRCL